MRAHVLFWLVGLSLTFAMLLGQACGNDAHRAVPVAVGEPLNSSERAVFHEAEACLSFDAREPTIRYEPVRDCSNGTRCCVDVPRTDTEGSSYYEPTLNLVVMGIPEDEWCGKWMRAALKNEMANAVACQMSDCTDQWCKPCGNCA